MVQLTNNVSPDDFDPSLLHVIFNCAGGFVEVKTLPGRLRNGATQILRFSKYSKMTSLYAVLSHAPEEYSQSKHARVKLLV